MRFSIALIFVAALVAVAPEVAIASGSGINQYVEQVPGAGGNHTAGSGGGNAGGGSNGGPVSHSTQQALDSQGAAGRATAGLANQTAPNGVAKKSVSGSGTAAGDARRPGSDTATSAGSSNASNPGGSSGIGIVLPVIFGLSLLAALAYAAWRRGWFRNFDFGSVFNRRGDVGG